ncbi:MAG TPA: Smr/MutS family protein, partial [Patescibacteria group bacterium]|nr:Smr/MutS family protein [Patescibacteria group bacterium]
LEQTLAATIESARERWRAAIETSTRLIDDERERFIAGIKDRAVELQVRSEARRQSRSLRDQLEQVIAPLAPQSTPLADPPGAAAIRPGMRVRLSGMQGTRESATVESVDAKGRAEVLVRGKRMTVAVKNLSPMEADSAERGRLAWTLPPGVKYQRSDKDNAPAEINLIGARVEEALERLDKFLDDAFLAGHTQVRIVHGHGTGRLRAALQRMLADHPHVESYTAAEERSGGTGATVANLRS